MVVVAVVGAMSHRPFSIPRIWLMAAQGAVAMALEGEIAVQSLLILLLDLPI